MLREDENFEGLLEGRVGKREGEVVGGGGGVDGGVERCRWCGRGGG